VNWTDVIRKKNYSKDINLHWLGQTSWICTTSKQHSTVRNFAGMASVEFLTLTMELLREVRSTVQM